MFVLTQKKAVWRRQKEAVTLKIFHDLEEFSG
jgi:hypothetical protein